MDNLKIKEAMATTGFGFAAVVNGVLDVRTVTDTEQGAALNCLYANGFTVIPCPDEGCDCAVRALARFVPEAAIVGVKVEISSVRKGGEVSDV